MKYTPITEKEADAGGNKFEPFRPGIYDFEVVAATEETSQASGNEQFHLELNVYNSAGEKRYIHDYLINTEGWQYKWRHFCEAVGLLGEYESGSLDAAMLEGCAGRCKVVIDPAKGQYAAKNKVQDYIKNESDASATKHIKVATDTERRVPRQTVKQELDDEIPFRYAI